MKTLTRMVLLVFALYLAGCATTQSGAGSAGSATVKSAPSSSGKMLTKEDYDRIGVKETGR